MTYNVMITNKYTYMKKNNDISMHIFDSLKFDGDLSPSEIMNKKIVGILRIIIVLITMYLQRIKFYIK